MISLWGKQKRRCAVANVKRKSGGGGRGEGKEKKFRKMAQKRVNPLLVEVAVVNSGRRGGRTSKEASVSRERKKGPSCLVKSGA